jgi:hypothetical protein
MFSEYQSRVFQLGSWNPLGLYQAIKQPINQNKAKTVRGANRSFNLGQFAVGIAKTLGRQGSGEKVQIAT